MIRFILLFAALLAGPAHAAAAATRSFTLSSFDRIRLEGPFSVTVRTGVAPFARAEGSTAALHGVDLRVEGRTLVIRRDSSSWGGFPGEAQGPVTIALGTHELTAAWLNGAGSLAIERVRGLRFDLAVNGSGAARISDAQADRLAVNLSGSADVALAGRAEQLSAIVRGSSSLDSSALRAKQVNVGAEGPALVRVAARDTAKIDAAGSASVTVEGSPACTVKAQGAVSIAGCERAR